MKPKIEFCSVTMQVDVTSTDESNVEGKATAKSQQESGEYQK